MQRNRTLPALLLTLATAFIPPAHAGDAPSAADVAALKSFRLDQGFLDRFMALQDDAVKDPCHLSMGNLLKGNQARSLDQAARQYDAQPGVHAMLARHGLTARQALIGMSALLGAVMQDMKETHPEMAQHMHSRGGAVSPQNMAFYRAHKAQIQQHQQTLGHRQLAAHGGKLPSCMAR